MPRPSSNFWKDGDAEDPVANSHPTFFPNMNVREAAILNYAEEAAAAVAWASGRTYFAGKVVTNGGHTYAAIDAHTSGGSFSADSTHWALLPVTKADVGLGNVDNTSDANKPISTAQAAALATKAPLSSDVADTGKAIDAHTGAPLVLGGGGGFSFTVVQRTGPVAIVAGNFAEADASGGTFTIPLPASPPVGTLVAVKKIDASANGVGVTAAGGGSIDGDSGVPNINVNTKNAGAVLIHRGSNAWDVFAVMLATGAQGDPGPAGAAGSVWLSGSGVPSSGAGANGDFYLRTSNGEVYKKVSGAWVDQGFTLVGPQGPTGATGTNGTNGILANFQDEGIAVTARDTLDVQGNAATLSQNGTKLILSVSGGDPRALTGATAAARFVGGTNTGAPSTGTFAIGDFVIARDGAVWICTSAGSPGTWTQVGGGGGGGGEIGAELLPSDFGVKAWTWAPGKEAPTNFNFDNGNYRVARIPIREAFTIGNVYYHKKIDGSGAHDYNGIGVVKRVGSTWTLLGKTADLSAAWAAGGDSVEGAGGTYTGSGTGVHPKGVTAESGQSLAVTPSDVIFGLFLVNMTSPFTTTRIAPYGLANWGPEPLSREATSNVNAAIPGTFNTSALDAGRADIPFLALNV